MSSIDKTTLRTKLEALIESREIYKYPQIVTDDVISIALSTLLIDENNILVVANKDELPVLGFYDSPDSIICYIENLSVFAISSNGKWLTLDGRLLQSNNFVGFSYAWGANAQGRLGDGTTTDKSSPVSVIGGFNDWCQVSAGNNHSLGVRQNGTAWAWGNNGSGRLGDGTTTSRTSPVSVVGGFTDWCQVSAGSTHSLGVRANGTAWAWGSNSSGQLGDGTITTRNSPVSVIGGFTDWCQVSAGISHSLGIRTNGTAWAWGANAQGRLGDNTTTSTSSPVSVVGSFTDWCQVSAGSGHSLGVRANGTAWGWGNNGSGRLGDGTTTNSSSPVSVVGGFSDWCQVSAGTLHSLGVRQNGTAWAWGSNANGLLGDGTTTSRTSPVSVVGGFTDWCQVSAGGGHSLGVRENGTAWAWGYNVSGRLGDGTTTDRSSPVSVVGSFTDWCQVSAGGSHSLAIRGIC
jgi:alpha-tubulin suppressor-like RCC1 family protein